jgi:outer membrane protein assembly factor BamB
MKFKYVFIVLILATACTKTNKEIAQFRGPNRDGIYHESGLMKEWPEGGPELLWKNDSIGTGYSSAVAYDGMVITAGQIDSTEYITAIDNSGELVWQTAVNPAWKYGRPGARSTPTVEEGSIYYCGSEGEITCLNAKDGSIVWSMEAAKKYEGKRYAFGYAESLLIVDDKLIFSPGGELTSMIALNKLTGEVIWESESNKDKAAYVSPICFEYGGKKIIATIGQRKFIGVDAASGDILWDFDYYSVETPLFADWAAISNAPSPVYADGEIYITSGNDHVGVKFDIADDASNVEVQYVDSILDNYIGGVVLLNGYLYGSNWKDKEKSAWVCVDWKTGETMYETVWHEKGSIIYADGMFYCYEESQGNVALVVPGPEEFKVVSSFKINDGRGPHFTSPAIYDGVLYIRHNDVLLAYNIKDS